MATFSKTNDLTALSLQQVANGDVITSSVIDLSTKLGAVFFPRFGRRAAAASTAGAKFRFEMSPESSGDGSWLPFCEILTGFGAAELEAVSGTVAAGQKVITVASTTGLTVGSIIFIDNAGTPAQSMWARIKSLVTNTSITVEDNLPFAATGCNIYSLAEIFAPVSAPKEAMRVRIVLDSSLFTQVHAAEVRYTTVDGIA